MLGHQVAHQLSRSHDVVTTVRKPPTLEIETALAGCAVVVGVDIRDPGATRDLLLSTRPHAVINAVGIVKQRPEGADPLESIEVNSLFPHRLASEASLVDARVIHISTDCVFSGTRGDYREPDNPDPIDLYGRSKLLGELSGQRCMTIRTSMIGLELAHFTGLIEWFLHQRHMVRGYTKVIWNGLTTTELARVLDTLVTDYPTMDGIWHVSGQTISKYELLSSLATMIGRRPAVVPDDSVVIDRSLNSKRFREAIQYEPPGCDAMLSELASAVKDRQRRSLVRR